LRYLFESTGLQHKAVKVAVTAYYGEAPAGLPQQRVVTSPLFVLPFDISRDVAMATDFMQKNGKLPIFVALAFRNSMG